MQSPELVILIHRAELELDRINNRHAQHMVERRRTSRNANSRIVLRDRVGRLFITIGTRMATPPLQSALHPSTLETRVAVKRLT
jgi:hypothetical protein